MFLQPTFVEALRTTIRTAYLEAYGKEILIPQQMLVRFLQQRKFTTLDDARAYFRRVILYYRQKYSFAPSFKHLITAKIPVLDSLAEWEIRLYRRFPFFQPVIFTPSKNALSMKYELQEALIASADLLDTIRKFGEFAYTYTELAYRRNAVWMLERAIYTMAYREIREDSAFEPLTACHKRFMTMRVPGDDDRTKDMPWYSAVTGDSAVFAVGDGTYTLWDALAVISEDTLWERHAKGLDMQARSSALETVTSRLSTLGKAAQFIISDTPVEMSREAYFKLCSMFPDVMWNYPYRRAA